MAGFFKKLFNRITGRKEDEVPVVEQLPAPLPEPAPAPEPAQEPEPEPIVEEIAPPPAVALRVPDPIAVVEDAVPAAGKAKAPPKKSDVSKPTPKVPAKRPEAKPVDPKPTDKKTDAKAKVVAKPEPKKPEAKRPEAKKPEPKKSEPKKPEPKKTPAPKLEPATPEIVVSPATAKVEAPPAPKPVPPPTPVEPPKPARAEPVVENKTSPERIDPQPAPPVYDEPLMRRSKPFAKEPAAVPAAAPPPQEPEKKGWFSRLKTGLSKSSKSLTGSITAIFTKRKLDATTLQELEDTLIQADLGITVAERIIKAVSTGRFDKEIDPEEVKKILADEVAKVLRPVEVPFNFGTEKPYVILVVGVNGSGKTTTIGKLGAIASGEDFKVKFAACDTFRAAAIEQLTVWGKRIGAETISRPQGADAAGLAFDAMKAAQEDGTDILFIDTAGRLHNKVYLMDELDKVVRVIKKYDPAAPHAVLLVLDATTGQNALAQAEAFTKVAGVTGLIMTKLDGTARGGILVAIAEKFKLPIHAIGVGETIDDLQPFDAEAFARTIAGLEDA
jgi:fused signal recognition particle receptor